MRVRRGEVRVQRWDRVQVRKYEDDSFRSKNCCSIVSSHCVEIFDNFTLLTLKRLPIITQFIFNVYKTRKLLNIIDILYVT